MSRQHCQGNAFLQALRIETYQGFGAPYCIGLLHGLSLLLLPTVALPTALRLLLGTLVLAHAGVQWYRFWPRRRGYVHEILLSAPADSHNGQWWLRSKHHDWLPATLCNDAFIGSWLLLLRFRSEFGEHWVPVVRSKINSDGYRRLRVRLQQPVNGEQ